MSDQKQIVIMITSDCIGEDGGELGRNLMKSYLYSLTETDEKPSAILFLNRGVYLTTAGSSVLDSLYRLASEGVELLSCGACLDYYQLEEALQAGEVTNMYYNVELMHSADQVITIG